MEKTETINQYELMLILDAGSSADVKEGVAKETSAIIEKNGGKVTSSEVWMEKNKFAVPINKKKEGTYHLIKFDAEGSVIDKVEPLIKLDEKILRFSVINVEK